MKKLSERRLERILIIKPSSMGDVLHAVPVLWGLRRRYPDARISWLVAGSCAPLIAEHPALNEVILFDRAHYGRLGRSLKATVDFVRFVKDLRRRRFDLIVDLQGLFRSGFLSLAAGGEVRIGFGNARELAWVFYTDRIPPLRGDAHAVDRNYRVARLLGFDDVPIDLTIPVSAEAQRSARAKLADLGLDASRGYLAAAPGARWETKRWLPEHFAQALDLIERELGARAVLLGSAEEADLCARVGSLSRSGPVSVAGQTSHAELVAAVDGARVLVCNDSGTKDVAVALGRPVVTIFGPTNPSRTGPYGRRRDVFQGDLDCAPCYLKRRVRCPYDLRCMREVSPAAVAKRVIDLWRGDPCYNAAFPRGSDLTIRTASRSPAEMGLAGGP